MIDLPQALIDLQVLATKTTTLGYFVSAATTRSVIVQGNPLRLALHFFMSPSTSVLDLYPENTDDNPLGMFFWGGSTHLHFHCDKDYALCTCEWQASAPGGSPGIYVMECLFKG